MAMASLRGLCVAVLLALLASASAGRAHAQSGAGMTEEISTGSPVRPMKQCFRSGGVHVGMAARPPAQQRRRKKAFTSACFTCTLHRRLDQCWLTGAIWERTKQMARPAVKRQRAGESGQALDFARQQGGIRREGRSAPEVGTVWRSQ